MNIRLRTILIPVEDLERELLFWKRLGLRLLSREDGYVRFEASPGVVLALWETKDQNKREVELKFLVDNIEEAYKELSKRGVEFLGSIRIEEDGFKWAIFKDPEGRIYTLMEFPGTSKP
ncbi:MAG: VOC family protein [Desulfurococcales archaeon]|nr:VOC family protein [Desulfurococcales archaeon]